MEKINVPVKGTINKLTGSIPLAPLKDVNVDDIITLKKDHVFTSVPSWTWDKMIKPKSVNVYIVNNRLFVDPVT